MVFAITSLFLFVSVHSFCTDAFLYKDIHIPSASADTNSIAFCTTRTLDDGSLKSSLLSQLKTAFAIEAFVETGTYLGNTAIKAAQIFDEVHTIELSPKLYLQASKRLKTCGNVTVHFGDSKEILPRLLPTIIDRRILFYLDGHYSGHATARGSLDTPILNELQAIEKADCIILIDDIRLFQESCFPKKIQSLNLGLETYPHLKELVRAIIKINPDYQICFLGDALLAFPRDRSVCISPVMRACALQRLESLCLDLSAKELKETDSLISHAVGDEQNEIALYYQTYSPFELEYGYRCYGCLWYALILREKGYEQEAQSLKDRLNPH